MKSYLRKANMAAMSMAGIIGVLINYIPNARSAKSAVLVVLFALFLVFYSFVEIGALRRLTIATRIQIVGNPMLFNFISKCFIFIAPGIFLIINIKLNGLFSCAIFSVLICFFVGGMFETIRLLRMVCDGS